MNYYLWNNGQEHGPYTYEQIQHSLSIGEIRPEQPARTEGGAVWKPIQDIKRSPASKTGPGHLVKMHLTQVRANSCYGTLRHIIEIMFVLACLGDVVYMVLALAKFSAGAVILTLLSGLVTIVLLIGARQAALVIIDIADTLLQQHARNPGAKIERSHH